MVKQGNEQNFEGRKVWDTFRLLHVSLDATDMLKLL